MKKYLLPKDGSFYKANLHCHTTLSDGNLTPEEVKKIYKENGYSIVAYTDHNAFIPHPELRDADFLPLNGYEVQITEEGDIFPKNKRTCHLCFIARDPDERVQPDYNRTKYIKDEVRHLVKYDDSLPDYVRRYSPESINQLTAMMKEKGFFVSYNHPTWSLESYPEYIAYENIDAMEIVNYSSTVLGVTESNARVYDDILRSGKRIYCTATDDNHNRHPNTRRHDSFGGFIMLKAEALEYSSVINALTSGSFYSSEGPEIKELTFDEGVVHIKTSQADRITVEFMGRGSQAVYAEDGTPVTEASFTVVPENVYFRITVYDTYGKRAFTNAYFTDTLFD